MLTTFLTKETNHNSIRTIKPLFKIGLIGVFLFLGLFFIFNDILALVDDNFDNYNYGDLVGQGNWLAYWGYPGISPWVVSIGYVGKGVLLPVAFSGAYKLFDTTIAGTLGFYFRIVQTETHDETAVFSIQNSANVGVYVLFKCVDNNCSNGVRVISSYLEETEIGVVSQGVWHLLKIVWNTEGETDEAKYQIDNEDWSDWIEIGNTNGLNRVAILHAGTMITMGAWFDEIGETGLYEPPPPISCEGLTGVELWLCNLRNDIKEIFYPSNQKIDELNETLNEIKQKFPMNYLVGASDFFSYIKENISSNSDINFKILGKSGTIDLSFWEEETIIGGIPQKISEIIKIFLIALIMISFIFWAISFGKRVF